MLAGNGKRAENRSVPGDSPDAIPHNGCQQPESQ
jgi:hypothetical protein